MKLSVSLISMRKLMDVSAMIDIVQYIMQHDEVRETIRSARDQPDVSPNWEDFINSFINE